MKKYRIIQWGTGYAGVFSLGYILDNPNLELVGVKCFTEGKEGKLAGELCGRGAVGVAATRSREALLDTEADIVVFMPQDLLSDPSVPDSHAHTTWFQDMVALLESGKNIITPICSGTHWKHMANGEAFRQRLDEACARGNSTVHFSGFDPGFTTDALAFTLSSVVGGMGQIRTWEIIDVETYTAVTTLQQLGFGARPEDLPQEGALAILSGWGGAPHVLAEALGVEVEDQKLEFDIYLAPETFTTEGGMTIEAGTIAGIRWALNAMVNGEPRFVINHITRAGKDSAPDWPNIGTDGGYRVEIDGFPPFKGDFPMGLPGGSGSSFTDAMAMTAARCVNSIEAIINAEPGYKTFLQLPPLGGRFAYND
jgi:hypothetical protein